MLWSHRCLKHYYREVKNSGRLEDKGFSAVAISATWFLGFYGIDAYGAWYIDRTVGGGNNTGHPNGC